MPPSRKPLSKLKEHLTSQPTSNAETAGASGQHHEQQAETSHTDQTPSVDWSLFVNLLKEVKNHTVETLTNVTAQSSQIKDQLARIEEKVAEFVAVITSDGDEDRTHYTTREFAEKLMKEGVKKFKAGVKGGSRQVRKWCREKRIKAEHRPSGRGKHGEYMIPHAEFVRYKNFGLLPLPED
jgi:hypothetical protein